MRKKSDKSQHDLQQIEKKRKIYRILNRNRSEIEIEIELS